MIAEHPDEIPNLSILEPLDGQHYQWRVCQYGGCNNVYKCFIGNTVDFCPEHREETRHGKHAPKPRAPMHYANWMPVTILSNPLPYHDGGFVAGAEIEIIHLVYMLQDGSAQVGMVIEWRGDRYTVTGFNELSGEDGKVYYGVQNKLKVKK